MLCSFSYKKLKPTHLYQMKYDDMKRTMIDNGKIIHFENLCDVISVNGGDSTK